MSAPSPPTDSSAPLAGDDHRANRQVIGLTAAIVAVSVALIAALPDNNVALRESQWWVWVVVAVLFGLFETRVFNVEVGSHGVAYSMSEIPLALALVFLSPGAAIAARLVFGVPVLLFVRMNRGVKLFFNIASFVFEVSLAFAACRGMIALGSPGDGWVLVALAFSLVVTPVAITALISIAITRFGGSARQRIASDLAASWWVYPIGSAVPVMIVALAMIEPILAGLAAVPIAAVWHLLRAYAKQSQALRDLDALHGLVGRLGESLDVAEIADLAVEEIDRHIRASGTALVRFPDGRAQVSRRGAVPLRLPSGMIDPVWRRLIELGDHDIVASRELAQVAIERHSPPRALIAGLNDRDETFGVLVSLERSLVGAEFEDRHVRRFHDIAEQVSVSLRRAMLHERLEYEARHDALTELPGRRLFEKSVNGMIDSVGDGVGAVMMLDLDRFKEVNDTLGHHAGDELLIEFSQRIKSLLSPGDTLARLAGDEFAVACHRPSATDVVDLGRTFVEVAGRPVLLSGLEIVVTVSVGVAGIEPTDTDALQPMRRADIAMYNAKWQRTGVEVYREEIDRRTPARLSMLGDLRAAIESRRLDVVYQPKIEVVTGRVVGAEALVRWEHDRRGVVPPTEFVRVAEDTGLIKELTDFVVSSGIEALAEFEAAGIDLGLAINLSTHDLFDGGLPDRVSGYLSRHRVAPGRVTLEITESALLVDAPRTRGTIDDLRAAGLRLAIDDFGTGYSSLSYLRRLPVHELKIDQSFVSGMLTDPHDEVIVKSTIDLGHNLGLGVVAEGVESAEVLDALRVIGCDVAQGFGIASPMTAGDLLAWMRASGPIGPLGAPAPRR